MRLPEPGRGAGLDDDGVVLRAATPLQPTRAQPPIPPAAWESDGRERDGLSPTMRAAGRVTEAARARSEPRLNRPPPR